MLLMCEVLSVVVLGVVGLVPNFWVAVTLLILGTHVCGNDAGAPDISQRPHSIETTRYSSIV